MFNGNTFVATLLAASAIFCLPRQFQISVIECADSGDLKRARWILPLYLGMFSVFAVPIVVLAVSGAHTISAGSDTLICGSDRLWGPMACGARLPRWTVGGDGDGRRVQHRSRDHDFE